MNELAILIPCLRRPHRVRPLLESICGTVPEETRVVFICDTHDKPQHKAIRSSLVDDEYGPLKVQIVMHNGSYARKIGVGVDHTSEPLLFLGADDLEFQDGWFDVAVDVLGAGVQVVGVNDLLDRPKRPEHATHFLMTREYAERPTIDGRPGPLYQGYNAWYCDDELIETAKYRNVYAYAESAQVKHLHPINGLAPDDETYRKGRRAARRDQRIFKSRERLWK